MFTIPVLFESRTGGDHACLYSLELLFSVLDYGMDRRRVNIGSSANARLQVHPLGIPTPRFSTRLGRNA